MVSESSSTGSHAKGVIEERRADLGLTQEELARKADISLSTLQRILRGHKPLLKQARALEDALEWQRGSLGTVLADGQPSLSEEPVEPEMTREEAIKLANSLEAQIQELQEYLRHIGKEA